MTRDLPVAGDRVALGMCCSALSDALDHALRRQQLPGLLLAACTEWERMGLPRRMGLRCLKLLLGLRGDPGAGGVLGSGTGGCRRVTVMLTRSYGGWRLCVCRRFNLVHLGAFPVPGFVQLDWEWQRDAVLRETQKQRWKQFRSVTPKGRGQFTPCPVLLTLLSTASDRKEQGLSHGVPLTLCSVLPLHIQEDQEQRDIRAGIWHGYSGASGVP